MPTSPKLPIPLPVTARPPAPEAVARRQEGIRAGAIPPPPEAEIAPLAPWLAAAAAVTQLPFWLLAAVIAQESSFDPRALSPAGAIGLMQIMPATARDCGLDPAQLWDPATNIHWGARILADNYRMFCEEAPDQRLQFALAAYNGGAGTVLAAQELAAQRHLDPHLWSSLDQVLPAVSVEIGGDWRQPDYRQIQNYVRAIWRRYQSWRGLPAPATGGEPPLAN